MQTRHGFPDPPADSGNLFTILLAEHHFHISNILAFAPLSLLFHQVTMFIQNKSHPMAQIHTATSIKKLSQSFGIA